SGVGVFLFKSPSRDQLVARSFLFVAAIVQLIDSEVPDAAIKESRHHRFFRQFDHAVMHQYRRAACPHSLLLSCRTSGSTTAERLSGIRRRSKRLGSFDFNVLGICNGALQE